MSVKPPEDAVPAEDEEAAHETITQTFFSIEGRIDPLELVIHALNESGATGVGRLLGVHEFDGDARR
jgi:hypothetical protein